MASLEVEVKIISRENIKPSSPTPLHLKTFNLSFFDQQYPSNIYASLLMFYPFHDHDIVHDRRRVNDLKSSLSETLTRFYPLAGRFDENKPLSIDCNDDGAEFVEAEVSCRLSDILNRPDPKFLSGLYPNDAVSAQDDHVLLVQVNLFECGGIAIGVSISHRISDVATLILFIKGWAAQASGGAKDVVTLDLNVIASCFPAVRVPVGTGSTKRSLSTTPCTTRRYVFDSKSINALRAKATSTSVPRPSRVQVVTGHICLSMMKLKLGVRSYLLIQLMNLRKKILNLPVSDNSFGNLLGLYFTQAQESDEKAITLEHLVSEFGRGLRNETESLAKMNDGREIITGILERRAELSAFSAKKYVEKIIVSSMCKSGCYENSDFGWGEPVWVGHIEGGVKNIVVLIDTKDGDGVEAWVTLDDEHDVDLLETDQDFLEFASLNPSVDLRY